ncbi:MAG: monovalent cation/H+ antiporter complex subunit F [Candidatus Dormibacteria bacterium]
MNLWLVAGIVMVAVMVPLMTWAGTRGFRDAVAAVALASVVTPLTLVVLTQAFNRPALIDLALVMAFLAFAGSLTYARFIERGLG